MQPKKTIEIKRTFCLSPNNGLRRKIRILSNFGGRSTPLDSDNGTLIAEDSKKITGVYALYSTKKEQV